MLTRGCKMKIHIIGGTGSGKTTLSRALANKFDLKIYELDDYYWKSEDNYTKKLTYDEMCSTFSNLVKDEENFITEGCYYECIDELLEKADVIVFLNTPFKVRRKRIYMRFIKTKLRIIKPKRRPSFKSVFKLYKSAKKFNNEYVKIVKQMLEKHKHKSYIITSKKEENNFINTLEKR
jgi:adenylate kinase family enzyme